MSDDLLFVTAATEHISREDNRRCVIWGKCSDFNIVLSVLTLRTHADGVCV